MISYNDLVLFIENDTEKGVLWKFRILQHIKCLSNLPTSTGKAQNIIKELNGKKRKITSLPLGVITADRPVPCAIYFKKTLKNYSILMYGKVKYVSKCQTKSFLMTKQAKLQSFCTTPK